MVLGSLVALCLGCRPGAPLEVGAEAAQSERHRSAQVPRTTDDPREESTRAERPLDAGDPGQVAALGGGAADDARPPVDGGARAGVDAVTLTRIDAFLRYQARRLTLEAALWAELEAAMPRTRRGAKARGAAAVAPSQASLMLLERRAAEDEAALADVGLTRAELSELGTLVREVLGPRRLARELALEETAALLEEQAERLTGRQREELSAQAAPLRARLDELMALEQVRTERGHAVVEAVLAREDALLTWEQARLAALAGR